MLVCRKTKCPTVAANAVVRITAPTAPSMVLFGLVLGAKLVAAEGLAAMNAKTSVELDGGNKPQQDRSVICVVGEIRKMPQSHSDKEECKDRQSDALEISLWLIAQDGNRGDEADGQRSDGDKKNDTSGQPPRR